MGVNSVITACYYWFNEKFCMKEENAMFNNEQCILYSVYCKENIGLMKEALRVLNGDKQVRATKTNTVSYFCETRQDKTSGTKEGQVLYSQLNSNGQRNISRKGSEFFSILYLLSLPQNLPSVGFWRWQGLEALAC